PDGSGNDLQELSLAGTVATGQYPTLPGTDGPGDITQNGVLLSLQRQMFEAHFDVPSPRHLSGPLSGASQAPQRVALMRKPLDLMRKPSKRVRATRDM